MEFFRNLLPYWAYHPVELLLNGNVFSELHVLKDLIRNIQKTCQEYQG